MEPPKRVRFGVADCKAIVDALSAQELWPYEPDGHNLWLGARKALEAHFGDPTAEPLFAVPTSSGTAAIHVALGGLQIPAGSEVIVPPITDMGTVMPVIFQNAIPVFADVDQDSGVLSADTIAPLITERTSAVIVVHLAGSPCDMEPIVQLCRAKKLKLIEDSAQGLGATYNGKSIGTFGDAGCFSLNSQKHITCGEGGFVLLKTKDDFLRCLNFSDKHRNRTREDQNGEHGIYAGPGINYRLSDLQLAMILSQLPQLPAVAAQFTKIGQYLDSALNDIDGVVPQKRPGHAVSTYFFHLFRLEGEALAKKSSVAQAMKDAAKEVGMQAGSSYGSETLFNTKVFRNRNFFHAAGTAEGVGSIWPAELVARQNHPGLPADYAQYGDAVDCPNAERWITDALSLYFHNGHTVDHAKVVVDAIRQALV